MSDDTAFLILLIGGLALFAISFFFWWTVFMAARAAREYFERENAKERARTRHLDF